jgi:hypothetical protein
MPRDGAIIFRDIVGKLAVLRVECDKCGRRGSYPLDRLIERYGIDAKLFDFEPKGDCPRKIARNDYDPCRGLESVPKVYQGLQSFRNISRMEASRRKASALRLRFSKSLARRRQRLSQAIVRSTIQRFGRTTNPLA